MSQNVGLSRPNLKLKDYGSNISWVSCLLQAYICPIGVAVINSIVHSAVLGGECSGSLTGREAGWFPGPMWVRWREDNPLPLSLTRTLVSSTYNPSPTQNPNLNSGRTKLPLSVTRGKGGRE
jgi:hypothetical protein